MTILIVLGAVFALATLVAIAASLYTARAADRRYTAAVRREDWERRQLRTAGPAWADEDTD